TLPLLSLRQISKSFGKVCVLEDISFEGQPGEIVAMVGENGAGKSTLMNIISGVWPYGSFSGNLKILGETVRFLSPKDAQNKGISIIHQELHLVSELSIAENIFLGREPHRWGIIDWQALFKNTHAQLKELDLPLSPKTAVKHLSVGEKQLVEIAKALSLKAQILILDEPTSALTEKETQKLFKALKKLKEEGVLCLYISHKLSEVFEISDRICVLRDGKLVSSYQTPQTTSDQVISDMVGRTISEIFPERKISLGKEALRLTHLNCRDENGNPILKDISLSVHEGEILGIAGIMGAGRSELIFTLFGATPFSIEGELSLFGRSFRPASPRYAIEAGLALLTEDRKLSGMIPQRPIRDNMTLASLKQFSNQKIINGKQEETRVERFITQFKIKTQNQETEIVHLSGGNQQKVLLARWLLTKPKVLFLDEPTRGVDVGAKAEIYHLIGELASQGVAIILISSELPEVLKLSDRIAVLNQGKLTGILDHTLATQEKIMSLATC
ncbi:MAG: sugar ABC transporter ATP-binding protein, partial [Deltaproteobacteria bacterium]|nr:sugar ABC transporter ATP-binding protein [Deltaproteobacteria bacterium]